MKALQCGTLIPLDRYIVFVVTSVLLSFIGLSLSLISVTPWGAEPCGAELSLGPQHKMKKKALDF